MEPGQVPNSNSCRAPDFASGDLPILCEWGADTFCLKLLRQSVVIVAVIEAGAVVFAVKVEIVIKLRFRLFFAIDVFFDEISPIVSTRRCSPVFHLEQDSLML